jgi:putative tryptophan/tyrosine transport system substrate-binding protein
MTITISRRNVVAGLAGATAMWLPPAGAQQGERIKRIGVLMGQAENDPVAYARLAAFTEPLATLGWFEGRNVRIDRRWIGGDASRYSTVAKELVSLQPDVIFTHTTAVTAAVQSETKAIPIVFALVSDPVASGFVESLSHPGGNITGFINLEVSLADKWVDLLKEIAPHTTRIAIMFNPQTAPHVQFLLPSLESAALRLAVKSFTAPIATDADIRRTIAGLAREPGTGMIIMPDAFTLIHRKSIIDRARGHAVPAMYSQREMVADGGLIAYGIDSTELFRRSASYIDKILHGAKPEDLPVQAPTKFELAINLKTAKSLGLTVPLTLLATADEVIE